MKPGDEGAGELRDGTEGMKGRESLGPIQGDEGVK
jgi:hypothetical protein